MAAEAYGGRPEARKSLLHQPGGGGGSLQGLGVGVSIEKRGRGGHQCHGSFENIGKQKTWGSNGVRRSNKVGSCS